MGTASGGERIKPQVADNRLVAEVIANDTIVTFLKSLDMADFKRYINKDLIPTLSDPLKRQEVMNAVLPEYVHGPTEKAGIPLFQAAGLEVNYNAAGVADALVNNFQKFNSLDDRAKKQWVKEIQDGRRFSSASFPPAGNWAPAPQAI